MGALAVGTTAGKPLLQKWHCHCMMEDGREAFIAVRAESAPEATKKAHKGYAVEFVLDTLTHDEMERKKRHLKPSIIGAVINF
jgi:hypothetical protein